MPYIWNSGHIGRDCHNVYEMSLEDAGRNSWRPTSRPNFFRKRHPKPPERWPPIHYSCGLALQTLSHDSMLLMSLCKHTATVLRFCIHRTIKACSYIPSSPSCVDPNHQFWVTLRHDSNIFIYQKCIVELACRLCLTVFNIANFAIDSNLHSSLCSRISFGLIRIKALTFHATRSLHQGWVSICNGCCQVQYASYRYRIIECTRIKTEESRSCMAKVCAACECQFKRLLKQKPTEDHEIVTIAILRLHDLRWMHDRWGHEVKVLWLARNAIWIWNVLNEILPILRVKMIYHDNQVVSATGHGWDHFLHHSASAFSRPFLPLLSCHLSFSLQVWKACVLRAFQL